MVDDDQCYCQKPRGTRKEVVPEMCETVKYSKVAPTTNQKQCSPQDFTWQLLGRVVDLTPSDLHLQQRRSVRHDTRRRRPPPTDRQPPSLCILSSLLWKASPDKLPVSASLPPQLPTWFNLFGTGPRAATEQQPSVGNTPPDSCRPLPFSQDKQDPTRG